MLIKRKKEKMMLLKQDDDAIKIAALQASVLFNHFGFTYAGEKLDGSDGYIPTFNQLRSTIEYLVKGVRSDLVKKKYVCHSSGRFTVEGDRDEGINIMLNLV